MVQMHGEMMIKIEIPHETVRKFCVFSDAEPQCIGHTNEYEWSLVELE